MKKWFIISASIISALVFVFMAVTCLWKVNIKIDLKNPSKIYVFEKSIVATQSNGYTSEDNKYNEVLEKINTMTNISIFNRLKNNTTLQNRIYQEDSGFVKTEMSTLKNSNYVIEAQYESSQDLLIYIGDNTRVVSYYWVAFVIPDTTDFTKVQVYISTTIDDDDHTSSYLDNDVFYFYAMPKELISYIKSL